MNSVEFKSLVLDAKVIVVKVGSSLVTNDGNGLDQSAIAAWAEQIAALVRQGKQVVLVSSGAVAEGMQRLGWKKRPTAVNELLQLVKWVWCKCMRVALANISFTRRRYYSHMMI